MTNVSATPPPLLLRQLGRKPVLWVGAGLSRQAAPPLPTLAELAMGLRDDPAIGWGDMPDDVDPYVVFDRCLTEGIAQPSELHDYLENKLRPEKRDPQPGALHRHLAELAYAGAFPFVVDPSYDLLLRRAMQELGAPHTHSVLAQNLARPGAGTWYLSIHGDLNDWPKVVLTRESHRRFEERYRCLRALFELLLLKHPVTARASTPALGRDGEASEIKAQVVALLPTLPEGHWARIRAERRFGLRA
ncbi:MAG TPA: SIR2 family protein [Polyangiaceae bacterium]|nr:SIR2 family protein [Polyangiaceae bacterium]